MRLLNFSTVDDDVRLGFKIGGRIIDARGAAVRKMFGQAVVESLPATVDEYLRAPKNQQDQLRDVITAGGRVSPLGKRHSHG